MLSAADGWTIDEALAEFARQGMPVDPVRFRAAVRVARIPRTGEASSGAKGGRGQAMYQIAQLQRLHSALAPWLTVQDDTPRLSSLSSLRCCRIQAMKEASIEKARAELGDIIDRVRYTGDPTLITRHGKPAALITPVLGVSDRNAIVQWRRLSPLDDPLALKEAREAVTDLLYIVDRYLAADQDLGHGDGH